MPQVNCQKLCKQVDNVTPQPRVKQLTLYQSAHYPETQLTGAQGISRSWSAPGSQSLAAN